MEITITIEFGSICLDPFSNRSHDLRVDFDQVITAHARFAGQTGGNDDNIGTFDVFVAVGAFQIDIVAIYRTNFSNVEHLALGQTFNNVKQNNITEFTQCTKLSENAADLSATDK